MNPRIRRIDAHDPSALSHAEYMRQIFWSSGAVVPEDIESAAQRVTLDLMELQPGEKAAMSLTLPKGLMKIDDGRSIGNPATSDEVDELLRSRMKILGLDVDAIGRDFREVFERSGRIARAAASAKPV